MEKFELPSICEIYDTHYDTKKIFVAFTTKFVRRDYVNQKGFSPLYLHVHSQGQRLRLALDLYVKPKQWLDKKGCAHKSNADLNLILENILSSITEIKTQYRLSKITMTLEKFEEEFRSNFSRLDFIAFMEYNLKKEQSTLSSGSYRRYRCVLNKLKHFKKNIYFSNIDYRFLLDFRIYLKSLKNKENTIDSNIAVFKKYLGIAGRMGIKYPLNVSDIKIKEHKGNRTALSNIDTNLLWVFYKGPGIVSEQKLILGYFLFSCFTGLRLQDVQSLKREDITDRFKITMKKSNKPITINLTETAKEILSITPKLFIVFKSDAHINRELKYIAKDAKLETKDKLTFHVSRHTFATNYLRQGGQLVYLSKLLGHSSIKTTMIYLSINEEEMNKDIHLLDNVLN